MKALLIGFFAVAAVSGCSVTTLTNPAELTDTQLCNKIGYAEVTLPAKAIEFKHELQSRIHGKRIHITPDDCSYQYQLGGAQAQTDRETGDQLVAAMQTQQEQANQAPAPMGITHCHETGTGISCTTF